MPGRKILITTDHTRTCCGRRPQARRSPTGESTPSSYRPSERRPIWPRRPTWPGRSTASWSHCTAEKWTTAAKAADRLPADVNLIAIDVPTPTQLNLPYWETSRMLAGTVFARRTDLSAKRNLALMLGRMARMVADSLPR